MTPTRFPSWPAALGASLLAAVLALACGGVDSGGTGLTTDTASIGRIAGFGSVIVNAVRYDDRSATIVDDDGQVHAAADLKLGMVVDIDAGPLSSDGTATRGVASRIQFGAELAGPVQAVDPAAASITVLGQSARLDADTVFDGFDSGVASVKVGDAVEVFGFYDPQSALFTATRIQRADLQRYRLRGAARNVNAAARTFDVGGAALRYGVLTPAEVALLSDGAIVKLDLLTAQQAGRWVVTAVKNASRGIPEGAEVELEGYISEFSGPARFKVQGTPVDAGAGDVSFGDGLRSQLGNGVRVEVKGRLVAGVLVARKVQIRKPGGGEQPFELHGRIDAVNPNGQTFLLRGVTVGYDGSTQYTRGSVVDLRPGAEVEVRAVPVQGGVRLMASAIKFED